MRAFLVCCWLCAAPFAVPAAAQKPVRGGTDSRVDLAVYGGGSWMGDWFRSGGEGFGIGWNPIFGGFVNGWATPRWGGRIHGAYIPSRLPTPDVSDLNSIPDGRRLNVWLYDAAVAYRPLGGRARRSLFSSAYLFAGVGAVTVNPAAPAGEGSRDCLEPYDISDACLAPGPTTKVQGTLGGGVALLRLTDRIGVFAEGAVHVYPSPVGIGVPGFSVGNPDCEDCIATGRLGPTTRLVGGLVLGLGRRPPPPALFAAPLPPAAPPPPPEERALTLCVQENGLPRYVEAVYLPATGDTLVSENGMRRPFSAVYPNPGAFASDREWFLGDENIFLNGREYARFGLPITPRPGEMTRVGEYRDIPLFTRAGPVAKGTPADVFLPVGSSCQLQPFRAVEEVRRVRG